MGYQIVVSHGTLRIMITHKKPVIFREGSYTLADVEALKRAEPIWKVCDVYAEQLEELFEITHADKRQSPAFRQDMRVFVDARVTGFGGFGGNWVYYPWSGVLVHTVSEAEYAVLRTNRNRNLITEEEQEKLLNCPMGIVGLSVGSRIASTLAYGGIGNALKLRVRHAGNHKAQSHTGPAGSDRRTKNRDRLASCIRSKSICLACVF